MSDDTPALSPPPGVTSNFLNPPSLDGIVTAVLAVCIVVSAVTTAARLYAQHHLFSRWTGADLCIVIAVGCHFAFNAVLLAALPAGLGRHQWHVRASDNPHIQYLLYVSYILYDPAITFAKISILLQFLHIFAGTYRNRFWYLIVALIAINVLFYIPETFAIMFSCSPREKIWDPSVAGTCVNLSGLLTASGPFNVVSDFLIFLLPMYAIWHLRIPVKKRIEVSCAFGVGLFGCLCSAVRIAYSAQLDRTGDSTYVIAQNQLWANAEITVGICIANSIIAPRLVRSLRSGSRGSNSRSRGSNNNNDNIVMRPRKRFFWAPDTITTSTTASSTLRNKTSYQSRVSATPRTLVEDMEMDTPFPAGEDFRKLERQRSDEMVTMDGDRDRVAPWFDTGPPA